MSAFSENDRDFHDIVPKPRFPRRFTLLHVVVVVGIIALVIGLLLPADRSVRPTARRWQCSSNLRQIALALHSYEQAYKALPPAHTVDANGRPLHSWRALILPYLDEEAVYQTIDLTKPWNDPANARALQTSISVYHCPEAVGPKNTTTYLASVGPNSCFLPERSRRLEEITDPHASTLMVIEAGEGNAVPWMAPVDADESLARNLGSETQFHHRGGMNACFVDGSVKFLSASISDEIRRAVISISGNDDPRSDELD